MTTSRSRRGIFGRPGTADNLDPVIAPGLNIFSIFLAPKCHESEDILAKTGQPYQINLFGGVEHEFAVCADITKLTIRFAKQSDFFVGSCMV
ncbi:unnamed protein product [Penicillium roqueforti FM164]|uniref:Genomic scaffold, ProqFM164S01 n=1 Tax=Penicillium roqueforti (strain FM164) TaxID=1365484 RepID=W6PRT8_PENRF|nr:unnamed protein product [Penicillium roqueforti FM164]